MNRRRSSLQLISLSIVVLLAPLVHAQSSGGSASPDALIRQGLDLREKGQDEAALSLFRQAYELSHSGRAATQMALAEQALGYWVDAEAHLKEALRRNNDEPWITQHKAVLDQALTDIQLHLGSLELSGGVAGAEVLLNNQSVATLPTSVPLRAPAGSVALQVRAPGYLPVVRSVIIPAGGIAREAIVLVPVAATATSPGEAGGPATAARRATEPKGIVVSEATPAAGDEWGAQKKVGLTFGLLGVASLTTGVIFGFLHDNKVANFNTAGCSVALPDDGPAGCSAQRKSYETALDVTIAGFVGAAVFGGVGALLFFTGSNKVSSSASASSVHGSGALTLRCLPSLDTGIVCGGRF